MRPVEMAQAAVMAALCAATSILSALIPLIAGLSLLGMVPMGLLAYRYRFRAFVGGTVAGSVIAFVAAGDGGLSTVLGCAYIGGITGVVKRRGRGLATVLVVSLAAGMLAGVASVATLMVLSRLRELAFASMRANVDGVAAVMVHVPGLRGLAGWIKRTFEACLHFWPWIVGGASVVGVLGTTLIGWWALSRVIRGSLGSPTSTSWSPLGHRADRTRAGAAARRPFRYPRSRPRRPRPGDGGCHPANTSP